MRSWLPDFARDDLVVRLALIAFLIGGGMARGENLSQPQARATLALAKAKRDREATSCFTDRASAVAESRRTRKPLVLWVGVTCAKHAEIRRDLSDAIHCHVPEQHGDGAPRIVIEGADGTEWFVPAEKINARTAGRIRAKWSGTQAELLRKDMGIQERSG
ncbi:MAG: hypothetical protein EXS09_11515 [Gemmataceae bacterium]|nr:hypothetical protein [Gemmataceae bacterium]